MITLLLFSFCFVKFFIYLFHYNILNIFLLQFQRQRSISLSSLDSEMEIELHGKSCTRPVGVGNRTCRSQASTHSLNEADLVQVI